MGGKGFLFGQQSEGLLSRFFAEDKNANGDAKHDYEKISPTVAHGSLPPVTGTSPTIAGGSHSSEAKRDEEHSDPTGPGTFQ